MIKGVITGDLVNSTNIAAEWRQAVVGVGCRVPSRESG